MTETCDRWSIALEQERQGELPPEERRALEQHLAGCERCRAERASIAALADELSGPIVPRAGWDDLRARIDRAQRKRQRQVAIGIAISIAVAATLLLVRGR